MLQNRRYWSVWHVLAEGEGLVDLNDTWKPPAVQKAG